jgi:hypothetical protein
MIRTMILLLAARSLAACASIQADLADQANPAHHPFHNYGASG